MSDMQQAIAPKSDQMNADDLIAGPRTIKITRVNVTGGPEQPVSISFEGDGGKPYKPCKSMSRVMVQVWGADSSKFVGKSMTVYRDPNVKWGGMAIGGIRISHITGIEKPLTVSLTASKGKWKPFTVQPLKVLAKKEPAKDPTTVGDVLEGLPPVDEVREVWKSWLKTAKFQIKSCKNIAAIDEWRKDNAERLINLEEYNVDMRTWLIDVIKEREDEFGQ